MTPHDSSTRKPAATSPVSGAPEDPAFAEVVEMIRAAQGRALAAVNTALVALYWQIGGAISRRISTNGWGKGTVAALSAYVQERHPSLQGFSPQSLWRMRQSFEAYRDRPELSILLRELRWSPNPDIPNRAKWPEEREFYLRLATEATALDGAWER